MKVQLCSRSVFLAVIVPVLGCSGTPARAVGVPRIELLREVKVIGARLLLSDLLPQSVPNALASRAAEISIGSAPQPGNMRTLERQIVMNRIGPSQQDLLSEIAIPEWIIVSRETRPLTVPEVLGAIRKALAQSGAPFAETLQAGDILLQSEILVSPGDAGLQVVRMELDAGLRRARFLLRSSHNPSVVPFFVTAQPGGDLPLKPIHFAPDLVRGGSVGTISSHTHLAEPENLVAPGKHATLVLHSATIRMFADVDPLERGTLGQQVPVRVVETGKIFIARVNGPAHLELQF